MQSLITAAGVLTVALVGLDIALTVLHPARRGRITHRTNRLTWQAFKLASQRTGRRWLRTYAGRRPPGRRPSPPPSAMCSRSTPWSPRPAPPPCGSATSRAATRSRRPPRWPRTTPPPDLARLHRSLIRIHQNLRRFPVLYYFQPSTEQESIYALLRSSALVCLVVRWGTSTGPTASATRYAVALEAALRRLLEDYATQYLRPRRRRAGAREVPDGFRRLLGDADDHLADLAADQGYDHEPLLTPLEACRHRMPP